MKINGLVDAFLEKERSIAVILSYEQVLAQAITATSQYSAYRDLTAVPDTKLEDIVPEVDISVSEWAIIRPLFLLYVERETALQLEATGMQGVNGYGRGSSEVNNDIAQYELGLPQKAFCQGVITVGASGLDSDSETTKNFPFGFNYPIY